MSAITYVKKTLIVPVYATVLSTALVACGGVTIKDESRLTGQNTQAAQSGNLEGSPEVQTKGLSLTLPAEMPASVDNVQITLIQQVEEVIPPTNKWHDDDFGRLPPCEFIGLGYGVGPDALGDRLSANSTSTDPCGYNVGAPAAPWWAGFAQEYPKSAAEIEKIGKSERSHKHRKGAGPAAKLNKSQAVQPVAFIPAHWTDKSLPAGCGMKDPMTSTLEHNDPLDAFLGEPEENAGVATSSIFSYSFGADAKDFSISDLEPGSYVIVIELIDSKTGSVVEKGETTVTVEAGKVSSANVKLEQVPATKGGIAITVERAPTVATTTKK